MKAIVLLSGGLDSATCLAIVRCFYHADEVLAVNMYYGQKHEKEMQAAKEIAKHYGVELMNIDLSEIFADEVDIPHIHIASVVRIHR